MSSAKPPPRNTNGTPFTANCREPFGAAGEGPVSRLVIVRMPKVSDAVSGAPFLGITAVRSVYSG